MNVNPSAKLFNLGSRLFSMHIMSFDSALNIELRQLVVYFSRVYLGKMKMKKNL